MSRLTVGVLAAFLPVLGIDLRAAEAPRKAPRGSLSMPSQSFHIGDSATTTNTISVFCGVGDVNSTDDIRIIIPAGVNMIWDTSITTATIGGSAQPKISGGTNPAPVTYANGNKTVILNVTTTFLSTEGITVDGLRFTNFTAASSGDLEFSTTGTDSGTEPTAATVTIAGNPASISSTGFQGFNIGDPATGMLSLTVTDHGTFPGLWATTDLRIRIPSTLNMVWQDTDTMASISVGAGTGTASNTVSYEDFDGADGGFKTLRVNITADFSAGQPITISGLQFQNFTAVSAAQPLTVEVNNQGDNAGSDSQDKQIGGTPSLSSGGDQSFTVNDPVTANLTITVTDASGVPMINTGNDLRIKIPSTFNMTWDTSDTTATFGGTALGKVGAITYEDSGRTLVIAVTTNFSASDTLTIADLGFANFTAASAPDSLELEVDGDASAEATDGGGANTKAIGAPTLSSASNQIFQVGDPPTPMQTATVTDDGTTPRITAGSDIRIRIPSGFNMDWDTANTAAGFGGTASGKVSNPVSYEDAGKTLVINVTVNFAAGDTLTVSGINFQNFSAPSLPDNLELEVNNQNTVADLDNTIIAVGGAPTISSGTNQSFTVNDPATAILTITIQDADGFPTITAANDIRIHIPPGFNMLWDTSDTSAVFGGTASGKVSNPVTFEDGNTTLVVNVTADFAVNETLTISGLSFASFSSTSAPDFLTLEVDNAGTTAATDGSSKAIGRPTISVASNQVFGTGDPTTAIATMTIADDGTTPRIQAGNDIRIIIPGTVDMVWDTSDTSAVIGGGAAGNVSATVSYEDAGKTLVIDVTTNFVAGDSITVSGLSFTSFNSQSGPDNLDLEVSNQNTVCHTATQTIQVSNRPTVVSVVTQDSNGNGSIDQLIVTYSEDMDGTTLTSAGYTVTGFAIVSASETSPGVATFFLSETGLPNTDATPGFSYDSVTGNTLDLQGLEMISFSLASSTDGAPPRFVSLSSADTNGNGFLNTVTITFSEPLAPGQEDINDWDLIDADGVTDLLAGLTNANLSISGNTLTFTLADSTGTAGTPRFRYLPDGFAGELQDAAGNLVPTSTNNNAPIANAGADRSEPPSGITLNGTGSSDPDGQPLSFTWIQTGGPAVTLVGPTTATPFFLASTATAYTFQLTVSDGLVASSDSVVITVINVAPNADAGFDQIVNAGPGIGLSASASVDVNGDALAFSWTQIVGTVVPIAGAGTATPTIDTTGINEVLVFQVSVSDGLLADTDTVTIRVNVPANGVPTANAGPDQVRQTNTLVTLDGRLSTDPDGDVLTFLWTPNPPTLLTGDTTATPSFTPTVPGLYTFTLTVNDGTTNATDTVFVLVESPSNRAPSASASILSPVGDILVGDLVTLDGTASVDPEGGAVSFAWVQLEGPFVALSDVAAAQPSFRAVMPGRLLFLLIVGDGTQFSLPVFVTVRVKATAASILPVAVPDVSAADDPDNDDRVSSTTSPIGLDGTASTGTGLTFFWEQVWGPAVVLTGAATSTPSFSPPVAGVYRFLLTVTDADGVRASTLLVVVVDTPTNESPTANAGPDQAFSAFQTVQLNGTASSDPGTDGDGVTGFGTGLLAFWAQTSGPRAVLSNPFSATPTFVPLAPGTYVFVLVVSDGAADSAPDVVVITVGPGSPSIVVDDDDDGRCGMLGWEAVILFGLLALVRRRR